MPVGTRAAVRAVDVDDLEATGTEIVLANTYHLMLRPGPRVVADLGGLHEFWGWHRPILTDSGGYQIFSLQPNIDEDGARFKSVYDGRGVRLRPEEAVTIQEDLGADIAMALDVCVALPAPREAVIEGMERTLRWAERSLEAHTRRDQGLFGIVQGGVDSDLRAMSAAKTAALGFAGFGIGGLSVGESPTERNAALDAAMSELPPDRVRYVMGLGDPEGVMEAVERGADLFDCVWPTRLARHGRVLTGLGDFNLRRAEFLTDRRPLEDECSCHTCQHHHRAYLRHLLVNNELAGFRLLSVHNLTYTMSLLRGIRQAITTGGLPAHLAEMRGRRLSVSAASD
jgi:queuine tRNA-ribosyltransferase